MACRRDEADSARFALTVAIALPSPTPAENAAACEIALQALRFFDWEDVPDALNQACNLIEAAGALGQRSRVRAEQVRKDVLELFSS